MIIDDDDDDRITIRPSVQLGEAAYEHKITMKQVDIHLSADEYVAGAIKACELDSDHYWMERGISDTSQHPQGHQIWQRKRENRANMMLQEAGRVALS